MPIKKHVGFHNDGRVIDDMSEEEVRVLSKKALYEGKVLAAVIRYNGDIFMHFTGEPDRQILNDIENAIKGYKKAMDKLEGN